ncbi:hypothetical protein [Parasedimentitalea psychrophila]|uniref:hypothetical protein n=1 Tax=Parasedimentitalea psychrophila TaxID=2997337 RepID=UPI0022EB3AB7|nr:hypothetical protein [Parasedimentitalea psychrophila]
MVVHGDFLTELVKNDPGISRWRWCVKLSSDFSRKMRINEQPFERLNLRPLWIMPQIRVSAVWGWGIFRAGQGVNIDPAR